MLKALGCVVAVVMSLAAASRRLNRGFCERLRKMEAAREEFVAYRLWLIDRLMDEPSGSLEEQIAAWRKLLPECRLVDTRYSKFVRPLKDSESCRYFVLLVLRRLQGLPDF